MLRPGGLGRLSQIRKKLCIKNIPGLKLKVCEWNFKIGFVTMSGGKFGQEIRSFIAGNTLMSRESK